MFVFIPPKLTGPRVRRVVSAVILVTMGFVLSVGPAMAQDNDNAYTEKILEFTTEPFFLTPYV
ncbi:MAG: hypothetical protein P8X82_17990, partial [Gemmatimonadales bacterium]